ncbi:hypothetical protein [Luteimonas suaedae]|uniref:hypothetical protein n=1 Tax=Luteimonas suaedae TaxID=2605430 RepID=UPI001658C5CF|nr:hypothetical protein [Luteimonas suaedae]
MHRSPALGVDGDGLDDLSTATVPPERVAGAENYSEAGPFEGVVSNDRSRDR